MLACLTCPRAIRNGAADAGARVDFLADRVCWTTVVAREVFWLPPMVSTTIVVVGVRFALPEKEELAV